MSHAAGPDISAICPEGEELDLLLIVGLVDVEVTAPSTLCTGSTVIIDSPARVTDKYPCTVTLTVSSPCVQQVSLAKIEPRLLSVPVGPYHQHDVVVIEGSYLSAVSLSAVPGTVCVNVTFSVPRLDPVPGLLWVINTLDKWPHV